MLIQAPCQLLNINVNWLRYSLQVVVVSSCKALKKESSGVPLKADASQ